jgi:hypothetical protein
VAGSIVDFDAHAALVGHWTDRRPDIADRLERSLVGVQGKETARRRDRPFFDRTFDAAFYDVAGLPRESAALKGQLRASHVDDGFEPTRRDRFATDLDPLELLVRAYEHWDTTHWPGRSGRLTVAGCLCSVFLLRHLEWLSLRIWDAGHEHAENRLAVVQALLDRLNGATSPITFVRDAAWLLQTAQGPLTPNPEPYFVVANHIAASFSDTTRTRVHAAGAVLGAGHLRSQLRYGMWRTGHAIDHREILAFSRNTNAMDHALLVRDLVGVLNAYGRAIEAGDREARARHADVILQAVSVDPDLYLVRQDLLAAYTSIEALHLEDSAGGVRLSAEGQTARRAAARCATLLSTYARLLIEDLPVVRPHDRTYSPLGIVYGFISDVLSNAAMDVVVGRRGPFGSLETMFDSQGDLDISRRRADGWAALPKRAGEIDHFEHSIDFAAMVYERLSAALDRRAEAGDRPNASAQPATRLFVSANAQPPADVPPDAVTNAAFVFTSDQARASGRGETFAPDDRMVSDRREGAFLASADVDGHWVGVSKLVLTLALEQGRDVAISHVPDLLAARLVVTGDALIAGARRTSQVDGGQAGRVASLP